MNTFKIHPNSAFTPLHNSIHLISYASDDMLNKNNSNVDMGNYLFSYGSNSLNQLKKRLKNNKLESKKAYVKGYTRIFAGNSTKWNGGVASIIKSNSNNIVKGNLVYLSEKEFCKLDTYEGSNKNINPFSKIDNLYRREYITVLDDNDNKINCITYMKNNSNWINYPSDEYLEAIKKNLIVHWSDLDESNEILVFDKNLMLRGKYS